MCWLLGAVGPIPTNVALPCASSGCADPPGPTACGAMGGRLAHRAALHFFPAGRKALHTVQTPLPVWTSQSLGCKCPASAPRSDALRERRNKSNANAKTVRKIEEKPFRLPESFQNAGNFPQNGPYHRELTFLCFPPQPGCQKPPNGSKNQ